MWGCVAIAIAELPATPFLVLSGDMQQLQPVEGGPLVRRLSTDIADGTLLSVELRMHAQARTQDHALLDFLHVIRVTQPDLPCLQAFFAGRVLEPSLSGFSAWASTWETDNRAVLTVLTVTNLAAAKFNAARVSALEGMEGAHVVPGEPAAGA